MFDDHNRFISRRIFVWWRLQNENSLKTMVNDTKGAFEFYSRNPYWAQDVEKSLTESFSPFLTVWCEVIKCRGEEGQSMKGWICWDIQGVVRGKRGKGCELWEKAFLKPLPSLEFFGTWICLEARILL